MDVKPPARPPPVPSIPAGRSTATHGLRPRRSSSGSVVPPDIHVKKRAANIIRTQTASPEVISSLIDSLSAIASSKDNYFENLPLGYGESTSVPASPLDHQDANGAYQNLSRQTSHLSVDDACEPPVIRTSKPPSGLSPLTAPKKREKEHSLRSYMSRAGGSSASLQSAQSMRSVSSIGNISIEAGIPRKRSDSSTRTSVESKRSAKGHRSLMYMSSRERLKLKDVDRKRNTIQGPEAAVLPDIARRPVAKRPVAEDTIKEEPIVAESSRAAQHYPSRGTSPLRNGRSFLDANAGGSPTEKGLIPERGSSLRHSGSPSRKSKKGDGRKSSRHDSYKTNTVPEEDEDVYQEVTIKDKILKELEAEEDEVAHRIRELRKQKLLRDKIAGKLPVGVDAGASSSSARVSLGATSGHSPTSSVSSMSERRTQSLTKAHKILGITMQDNPPEKRVPQEPDTHEASNKTSRAKKQIHAHSRTRSVTVNDSDELTPLPINYRLALQSLERIDTNPHPPPSSGNISTSTGESRSSSTPPRRAKSMAVGGRSATSRRSTSSMIMGANTAHNHVTNVTSCESGESIPKPIRSASDEIATRHLSLSITPSTSSSFQHRPTVKKKRWSHPDLPAKAERSHNAKVDALRATAVQEVPVRAAPVQSPPRSVIEERPASMDSIDMEVEGYLNSPRLSQKIRHPQTGRVISFSEVGDPQGFAVFVCVGMGLTRYVMAFYDQLALTLKLRLITPDRPGIGGSQIDPNGTPLSWPDDVLVICQALKITKFSLLAHSAGAIYALATSLRMPQHIRGQVHLLAPWIPPSQMAPIGISQDQPPTQQLPRSQRFLRVLPPSLLKVANSTFLSATSASLQRTGPKSSPKAKRKSVSPHVQSVSLPPHVQSVSLPPQDQSATGAPFKDSRRESMLRMDQIIPNASSLSLALANPADPNYEKAKQMKDALTAAERQRQQDFDERLTFAIWDRATAHANPATDLIVCLETKQTIGFRYEDINRSVVIHHGSKDSRVPADNVRWLGRLMRKCEVRILEGEQHGLMASAQVMGSVLTEMASDWEDWTAVVQGKAHGERSISRKRTAERLRSIASRHGHEATV
ncbi:alpha/beta-hydrolase [Bimuria novae-zelandiae CBS 107.79]|uniref:Alpha/beta-hydrolase n=1 Tax=Bimuria novae-zelandiae CBS 107.79 TaxID=1447943 RepID=A0A6A5UQC2_9PLEO|nr:alpha/beta-hydrolase [Bimuria novae-zelandiae CBS 107.79]